MPEVSQQFRSTLSTQEMSNKYSQKTFHIVKVCLVVQTFRILACRRVVACGVDFFPFFSVTAA